MIYDSNKFIATLIVSSGCSLISNKPDLLIMFHRFLFSTYAISKVGPEVSADLFISYE